MVGPIVDQPSGSQPIGPAFSKLSVINFIVKRQAQLNKASEIIQFLVTCE